MQETSIPLVRNLRRTYDLTQDDLATLLGSNSRSYISMLESGDRVPHIRDAVLLAWLFNVPSADLFSGLYLSIREQFRQNMRRLIDEAIREGAGESERVAFLRQALTAVEIADNVDHHAV